LAFQTPVTASLFESAGLSSASTGGAGPYAFDSGVLSMIKAGLALANPVRTRQLLVFETCARTYVRVGILVLGP
jgi:hypothetical protein